MITDVSLALRALAEHTDLDLAAGETARVMLTPVQLRGLVATGIAVPWRRAFMGAPRMEKLIEHFGDRDDTLFETVVRVRGASGWAFDDPWRAGDGPVDLAVDGVHYTEGRGEVEARLMARQWLFDDREVPLVKVPDGARVSLQWSPSA